MNSLKRKSAIAAVMLAVGATAFGAQAADRNGVSIESPQQSFESAGSVNNYTTSRSGTGTTVAPRTSDRAARNLENFEKQMSAGSVENYDPAEHPPVVQRHSLVTRTSPFDRFDLASPGG